MNRGTTSATPTLLLETSEVARALGLSYSGVYALIVAGHLRPDAVTGRGLRLFLPSTVQALKNARAAAAGKDRP
jgi:hypothetical protein